MLHRAAGYAVDLLQLGRRSSATEIKLKLSHSTVGRYLLQLGRRSSATEISRALREEAARHAGFNWAVALQRRRSAEVVVLRARQQASIGPSLFSDGDRVARSPCTSAVS